MKASLGAQCDEFYSTSRLSLKLGLSLDRESTLHFFDRVRREYPSMRRLRRREDDTLLLEENDDDRCAPSKRWLRLDPQTLRFGYVAPPSRDLHREFGAFILEQAPAHLTISDLDIDHMEVLYGFDMEYTGNHDQLVAETLFADHPLAGFFLGEHSMHTIDCQPCFGISLTRECDAQAYLEIKSRTSSFEVRTGQFDAQVLSVYLTVRRYWGFSDPPDVTQAHDDLLEIAHELAVERAVPLLVNPLAHAIASRP